MLSLAISLFALSAFVNGGAILPDTDTMLAANLNLKEFSEMMAEADVAIQEEEKKYEAEVEELKKYITPRDNMTEAMDEEIVDLPHSANLYEGDIALTTEQLESLDIHLPLNSTRRKRQAATPRNWFPRNIWGETPIPYTFDRSITAAGRAGITNAINLWQSQTCVRFVERAGNDNGITFFRGQGCWSYVGKTTNTRQQLSIGDGCESTGTAAHEIQHALGTWHVQSRSDRDSYVRIDFSNIDANQAHNFNKESAESTSNYGIPYEYGSNMHYHQYGFAKAQGRPTMLTVQREYQDSQGSYLPTFYDVKLINEFYSCSKKCPTNRCQNGGYPNPNNCNVCLCPKGYGGTYCSDKPSGCVKEVKVTTAAQQVQINIGNGQPKRTAMDECTYVFTADAGRRIQLTMTRISGTWSTGCALCGLEVIPRKDTRLAGFKYCMPDQQGKSHTSDSNRAVVVAYSSWGSNSHVVTARAV